MTIFLDLTRISTRLLRGGPTGIDRVEFAYADSLVGRGAGRDVTSVLTTPFAHGAVCGEAMARHLARIERAWARDRQEARDDPFFAAVCEALSAPVDRSRTQALRLARTGRGARVRRAADFPFVEMARAPFRFRRALRSLPPDAPAVYFHASHTQLDRPERFEWLARHRVPSVFLLHDTIPIDWPEYCSPGSAARHEARLRTVSRHASVVVANSQETARSLDACFLARGWRRPPIETVPLGMDDWRADATAPEPPRGDYFLVVGTMEPRKNLPFLFEVWRELVARRGACAPRLVLAGRRGWENEAILDTLERSRLLAPFLVEINDISDAGLAALMRGAKALLAPTKAEGFSLPVMEALALGTPVLASDIPVHREVARGRAGLVASTDGPGWLAGVEALADAPNAATRVSGFEAPSWADHVAGTLAILDRVARTRRAHGRSLEKKGPSR